MTNCLRLECEEGSKDPKKSQLHDITNMGVSTNRGFSPQIMNFNRVFHYFHHPFWGTTIFGNTHIYSEVKLLLIYQHLQRGAKWLLNGVNSPSLRV